MNKIRQAVFEAAKAQLDGLFNESTAKKIATGIAEAAQDPVLAAVVDMLGGPSTGKKGKKGGKPRTRGQQRAEAAKSEPPKAEEPKAEPAPAAEQTETAPATNGEGDAALNLI